MSSILVIKASYKKYTLLIRSSFPLTCDFPLTLTLTHSCSNYSDGRVEPVEVLEAGLMWNRTLALSQYHRNISWTSGCIVRGTKEWADLTGYFGILVNTSQVFFSEFLCLLL